MSMTVAITVPSVGESITEGRIARWLKQDGEAVRADEPVLELETDKATGEIPAPAAGVLRIGVPEGETVPIGAVVGRIEEGAAPPRDRKPTKEKEEKKVKETPRPRGRPAPLPSPEHRAPREPADEDEAVLSPAARQLAESRGVNVRQLAGTGRGGRITKEDVLAYLEEHEEPETEKPPTAPARAEAPPDRETRQRMSAIRQRIAERLVAAQSTAAILSTFNEV